MLGRGLSDFTWTQSQSSDHHGVARELLPWLGGATQVPHHDRPVSRGAEEAAGPVNTGYLSKTEKAPVCLFDWTWKWATGPGCGRQSASGWEGTACGRQHPAPRCECGCCLASLRWSLCLHSDFQFIEGGFQGREL